MRHGDSKRRCGHRMHEIQPIVTLDMRGADAQPGAQPDGPVCDFNLAVVGAARWLA